MVGKTELRYLTLFSLSLLFSGVLLGLCIQKYSLAPLYFFLNQCTSFTAYITGKQSVFGLALLSIWLGTGSLLVFKVLLSLAKTHLKLVAIKSQRYQRTPTAIAAACRKFRVSTTQIISTTHDQPLAFTIGFFRPKIVMSKGLIKTLNAAELEAVFLHELYHLQHHHGLVFITGEVVSSALTLILPFLHDVRKRMRLQLETAADLFASQAQHTPLYLSQALTKLRHTPTIEIYPGFASAIKYRSQSLHSKRPLLMSLNKYKLVASLIVVYALCYFALSPRPTQASNLPTLNSSSEQCQELISQSVEADRQSQSEADQNFSPALWP